MRVLKLSPEKVGLERYSSSNMSLKWSTAAFFISNGSEIVLPLRSSVSIEFLLRLMEAMV